MDGGTHRQIFSVNKCHQKCCQTAANNRDIPSTLVIPEPSVQKRQLLGFGGWNRGRPIQPEGDPSLDQDDSVAEGRARCDEVNREDA